MVNETSTGITIVIDAKYDITVAVQPEGQDIRLDINVPDGSPIVVMSKQQARDLIEALWIWAT